MPIAWFLDRDGDGYGELTETPVLACEPPAGSVTRTGDCDDSDSRVAPGRPDGCDGVDNDCDGATDENALTEAFYVDEDGDGAGGTEPTFACLGQPGVGAFPNDCDDADPRRAPGLPETCDGLDNDCDSVVDEGRDVDLCALDAANASCIARCPRASC